MSRNANERHAIERDFELLHSFENELSSNYLLIRTCYVSYARKH